LQLLAHTDYFVGSFTSAIPWLIEILRYTLFGKHRYTAVDASKLQADFFERMTGHVSRVFGAKGDAEANRRLALRRLLQQN
jgi:hypothetical protein